MFRALLYFVISFGFSVAFQSELALGGEFPYIRISSQYTSFTGGEGSFRVRGTGILVELLSARWGQKYFVITASHVSQGEKTLIEVFTDGRFQSVEVIGRLADSLNDIEVFEVKTNAGVIPAAIWVDAPGVRRDFIADIRSAKKGQYYHSLIDAAFSAFRVGPRFTEQGVEMPDKPFLIIPDHPFCGGKQDQGSFLVLEKFEKPLVFNSYFGGITAPMATIAPGMSGAPLFRFEKAEFKTIAILDGVATQYERAGVRSMFASRTHLFNLLDNYLKQGERGLIANIHWRYLNGNLFREFCNGKKGCSKNYEIASATLIAGGPIHGDGGDFIDPVKDLESTKGVCTPIETDSISQVTGQGLNSGVLVNGREVLAFKISNPTTLVDFTVDANPLSLNLFLELGPNLQILEVHSDELLLPILLKRIVNDGELGEFPIRVGTKGVDARIEMVIYRDRVEFALPGPFLEDGRMETLKFSIGPYGNLIHDGLFDLEVSKMFRSIVEVHGLQTGAPFLVDLRELFFIDPYVLPRRTSLFEALDEVYRAGPTIRIRPKDYPYSAAIIPFNEIRFKK